ncbi:MAG: hypothetical protein ACOC2W_02405 [bacterium]
MSDMFEKATRMKLRFNQKGICSVEDLWDLPLNSLDSIFKELNAKIKEQKEESLLNQRTKESEILDLKINIVKYIVNVRLQEQKERENKLAKESQKKKLLEIIAEKQDKQLYEKNITELNKMVEELEKE